MLAFHWLSTLALSLGLSHAVTISASSFGDHDGLNRTERREDSTSYVQAAYFTSWGIYAANFQPMDIDPEQLTHILYAFADVSPTASVFLTDRWADEEKHYSGDSWNDVGNNLYGSLKQLYLLKLAHRHLKVLLSVGGWTYSQDDHFGFITNDTACQTFASSVVQLVKDYGFDGVDIDFEYPASTAEGQGFLALMTAIRSGLDDLAYENGDATPYELTAAVSAAPQHNAFYPIQELDSVLTYWNLMAYDYAGPWSDLADNQANLYGGATTGISTDAAVDYYVSSGATPRKILIGIPLYGRAFENTGGIGQPYDGIGPGTLQAGIYSYKDLPLSGASIFSDDAQVASYSYDADKRELVSYDIPDVVRHKADYVKSKSLGGCMFWELSTDKKGSDSLVQTAYWTLGQLDQTPNHIHYPNSKWDNIRSNMGSPAPLPAATPTHAEQLAPTEGLPASCLCDGVLAWSASVVYTSGHEVVCDSHLWTAKWWTENDRPGGTAGVWEDDGVCD